MGLEGLKWWEWKPLPERDPTPRSVVPRIPPLWLLTERPDPFPSPAVMGEDEFTFSIRLDTLLGKRRLAFMRESRGELEPARGRPAVGFPHCF